MYGYVSHNHMHIELIEIIFANTHIYIYSSFWYFSQFSINRIRWSRSTTYWLIKIILRTCLAHLIMITVRSFKKIVECSADITVLHIQVLWQYTREIMHPCMLSFCHFSQQEFQYKTKQTFTIWYGKFEYHPCANERNSIQRNSVTNPIGWINY